MQSAHSSRLKFQDQINIGMNEDAITKEEFEFRSAGHLQKRLKLLQRLSGVAILLSLYQLAYGGLSLYYFQSTFPSFSTFMGVISLLLSITVAIWSTKALKAERNQTTIARSIIDGSRENLNNVLFLSLVFRAVSSLVLIPNMFMQADFTSQHVAAQATVLNDPTYVAASRFLTNMALPLPFVELVLSMILIKAAKTCFSYIKDSSRTVSRLVYLSNTLLLSSSLGLVFNVLRIQHFLSSHYELLPSSRNGDFKGLLVLGVTLAVASLIIWLVNYKRWRAPSLILSALTLGIIITLAVFTAYSYNYRENVYRFYEDSTDLASWSSKMANTHKDDIEAFGCPSKYLPQESCSRDLLAYVWETDDSTQECLNMKCSGLLGGLHSKPFLETTNFCLISIVSGMLAILGGLIFWRFDSGHLIQNNKKDFKWLGVMAVIIMLFMVALTLIEKPYLHQPSSNAPNYSGEHTFLKKSLAFDQSTLTNSHINTLTILAQNVRVAPKLSPSDTIDIIEMVVNQKYKYIVLDLDVDQLKASIEEKGTWDESYDDFVENFSNGQPKVGLIYLEVEEGENKLVAVIYKDDLSAKKSQELLGNNGVPNFDQLKRAGILPYIAHDIKDLKLENVLAGITSHGLDKQQVAQAISVPGAMSLWNLSPFYEGSEGLINDKHDAWVAPFSPGSPSIAGLSNIPGSVEAMRNRIRSVLVGEVGFSLGSEVFKMITMNRYKYLISKYSTELQKPELVSEGERNASYKNFIDDINPNQAQVSLIYLDLEDSDKLVMIIYAPEGSYNNPNTVYELFGLPADPMRLELIGLRVFIARNMNDLNLNNVMKHLYGDHQKIMNLIEVSLDSQHDVRAPLNQRMLLGLEDTGDLLETVITRKHKYIVLKWNPLTERAVLVQTGDWDDNFGSFVDSFHEHDEQIGLIYLELEETTKPVLVVFGPKQLKKDTAQILHDFNLPAHVESMGVDIYTANNRKDLTVKNILRSAYTNVTAVQQLIEEYQLLNLLDDNSEICLCDTCHCNSNNVTEDDDYLDSDYTDFDTDVFTTGANINLFGNMGLRLKRDIVKPIKSKQLKYVILKRDPTTKKVFIANSGTWFATFDQFAREFEANQPQVGFIYLEIEGVEKLAMVVYAPQVLNMDYMQVLKDFDVTKNPTKLRKKGIETFVLRELNDLTLDNIMGAVFGAGTKANMMFLTQLVEEYAGGFENNLMFALSNEAIIEMQEASRMTLLNSLGLKVDRGNRKLITNHKNKYVIFRKNPDKKALELKHTGTWHATFDQFARDIDPTEDQVGFIYLELESKEKLVMVLYSPRSYNQTFKEIFKGFGVAKSVKKLEKKGISTYVARNNVDLQLENVLSSVFNAKDDTHNVAPPSLSIFAATAGPSTIPDDITDAITNKKYKYIIMQHDKKKKKNDIITTGDLTKTYDDLVKQVKKREDQLIFVHLNLESKPKLVIIPYSRKTPTGELLASFGLPEDVADLQNTGLNVYPAHNKKDLDVLKVLKGIYTTDSKPSLFIEGQSFINDALNWQANNQGSAVSDDDDVSDDEFLSLWESSTTAHDFNGEAAADAYTTLYTEQDFPYGKDVIDAINNKKFKYLILKHDTSSDKTYVDKFGKWDSTYKDFQKAFSRKESQVGMIHITIEARDLFVLVIYTPKLPGTETLRQFSLPHDINALQNLGFRPYVARKKSDLDLMKVLQGVYNEDIFVQNNPVILVGESSGSDDNSIWLEAFKMMSTKQHRYLIVQKNADDNKLSINAQGDWSESYDDFVRQFDNGRDQVGVVYVGAPGNERLVLVVFASSKLGRLVPDVAKDFRLPKSPKRIQNLGFTAYVAHSLDDLQESKVLDSAYSQNLVLFDLNESGIFNSDTPLWEERDGFAVPRTIGYDHWLRLFDLQGELKRKISDITVDDSVIHTWNDFVVNHDNGYALLYPSKGSLRLSVQEVEKGVDVTYSDFKNQLQDTPLFALVFTQDIIRLTNIQEPVLFEWKPNVSSLVERTLSRDRLKPLQVKLNNPRYVYVSEGLDTASIDNVLKAINNSNQETISA